MLKVKEDTLPLHSIMQTIELVSPTRSTALKADMILRGHLIWAKPLQSESRHVTELITLITKNWTPSENFDLQ